MNLWDFSLVALIIIEFLFPRYNYKFIKKGFYEDIFYMVLIVHIIPHLNNLIPWTLDSFYTYRIFDFSKYTFGFQLVLCFLLTDLLRFFTHLSMHRVPLFWKFHKLHHATTEMTVMSAFRNGYWEDVCLLIFTMIPMSLLKFNMSIVNNIIIFYSIQGYFVHANIKITFPKYLRFFADPQFHQWHHAVEEKFPRGQNFSVALTFWDILYGTYFQSSEGPRELGLYNGEVMKGNYLKRFFYPLTGK